MAHSYAMSGGRLVSTVPCDLFIAGEWRETNARFPVDDPATGEVIAEVADGSGGDARDALDAAVEAQSAWAAWTPRARAELLRRAHGILLERADLIIRTMTIESGKPLAEARGEFMLSADFWLWYAEQVAHVHGSYAPASRGGYRVIATYQPIGPCLLVTPWNFPLLMIARKAGAALAAGCAVIVKSAQETPLTAALFVQVLEDAGFPAGVVNLLSTSNASAISKPLLEDSRLRKISFTGSTGVGSTLLELAAKNIVSASMELGGDGPFIVLEDADIDLAVEQAILCKFRNAGQACVAANRIIVHETVASEFTQKFVTRARALRVGSGLDDNDVGPVISARQLDRVGTLVRQLTDAGAEVLLGGMAIESAGHFFAPTILRIAEVDEKLCGQELFAPVATLFTVASTAEAVEFANATHYGLAAYLFTKDISRAMTIGERLDFGMVGINRGIMADPSAPFGGTKASGLGREGGHRGIHEFMEEKYLALTVDEEAVGL